MPAELTAAAFKHAPWSMSKASVALTCPFRYQLKYIQRVKGREEPAAATPKRIGIAAHEALEWVLKGQHDLQEALRRAAIKSMLTTPEMDEVFALAHNLRLFLERLEAFKAKNDVQQQSVELKFGLTRRLEHVPFFDKSGELLFRGVWDLCLRTSGNYLIIVDHKSGEVKDVDAYREQLDMYALAGIHVFPGIVGVQPAIHYMQDDTGLHWDKLQSVQQIEERILPWFVDYLNRAGDKAEHNNPCEGKWCGFCEYTNICPLRS